MDVRGAISEQVVLAKWIHTNFLRTYPVTERTKLSLVCFDLAIEHHRSIAMLGRWSLYGSLYALLRVQFEAYGRGLWLQHASDADLVSFKKDSVATQFGKMLREVERSTGIGNDSLSALSSDVWALLCSFTHTGFQAISRRILKDEAGFVHYEDIEVIAALNFSGILALLAACELSLISSDQAFIKLTTEQLGRYAKIIPDMNAPAASA